MRFILFSSWTAKINTTISLKEKATYVFVVAVSIMLNLNDVGHCLPSARLLQHRPDLVLYGTSIPYPIFPSAVSILLLLISLALHVELQVPVSEKIQH